MEIDDLFDQKGSPAPMYILWSPKVPTPSPSPSPWAVQFKGYRGLHKAPIRPSRALQGLFGLVGRGRPFSTLKVLRWPWQGHACFQREGPQPHLPAFSSPLGSERDSVPLSKLLGPIRHYSLNVLEAYQGYRSRCPASVQNGPRKRYACCVQMIFVLVPRSCIWSGTRSGTTSYQIWLPDLEPKRTSFELKMHIMLIRIDTFPRSVSGHP